MKLLLFYQKKACQNFKSLYNTQHQERVVMRRSLEKQLGDVAELVDALDLGSSAERCESSSLSVPTKFKRASDIHHWFFSYPNLGL